jgi:DNA polymerase-3 subunit gamma/tau
MDVVEMDAASESSVDEVRETIVSAAAYSPTIASRKVFIIDEVHDLSGKAFDALLKTIEEPPPHVVFILATTEFHKVPATIRSRCQIFEFRRGSLKDLIERLEFVAKSEGVKAERSALEAIAKLADGGYRDALTLFEQVMVNSPQGITLDAVQSQLGLISDRVVDKLLLAMSAGEIHTILDCCDEVIRRGRDPQSLVESIVWRLADLTRASVNVSTDYVEATELCASRELSAHLGLNRLLFIRGELAQTHRDLRDITLPRLFVESELIRISQALQQAPTSAAGLAPRSPGKSSKQAASIPVPASNSAAVKETYGSDNLISNPAQWNAIKNDALMVSKTLHLKLSSARGYMNEKGVYEVELASKMQFDWFEGKPEAKRQVVEFIRKRFGEHTAVTWKLSEKAQKRIPRKSNEVEIPLEGTDLVDEVRRKFGE